MKENHTDGSTKINFEKGKEIEKEIIISKSKTKSKKSLF